MSDDVSHDNSVKDNDSEMTKVTVVALVFVFLFVLVFSVTVLNVPWVSLFAAIGAVLTLAALFMLGSYAVSACARVLLFTDKVSR